MRCSWPADDRPGRFFRWWIHDERTGKRLLTTYKLSRVNADRAFPGAEPDPETREIRNSPHPEKTAPIDKRETD